MRCAEYKQQPATHAEHHAEQLSLRDRLPQNDGGKQQGEYRSGRGDDRTVNWRCHLQPHHKQELVDAYATQAAHGKQPQISACHPLPRQEKGQQPKQDTCHGCPKKGNDLRLYAAVHQVFEYRHTDAEQDIRCQYEGVSFHAARFTRCRCVFCFPRRLPSVWAGMRSRRDNPLSAGR